MTATRLVHQCEFFELSVVLRGDKSSKFTLRLGQFVGFLLHRKVFLPSLCEFDLLLG